MNATVSRAETAAQALAAQQQRSQQMLTTGLTGLSNSIQVSGSRRDHNTTAAEPMALPASSSPLYAPTPSAPLRMSQGACGNHNIETAINIMANSGITIKNMAQIQEAAMAVKQPCLFEGAYIFGGSGCSNEVFNGVCSFHWKMMNIRVGVCENYTALNDAARNFVHYEMMVDKIVEDRSLTPIFPYINKDTTMYDVLLGFNYATVRGLEETKKNEGAAMAYALYYMVNSGCRFDWMVKAQHWIDSMSMYLMACVLYNDKLTNQRLIPNELLASYLTNNRQRPNSVLHRFFQKNVLVRNIELPYQAPESVESIDRVLTKRDVVSRTFLKRNDAATAAGGGSNSCGENSRPAADPPAGGGGGGVGGGGPSTADGCQRETAATFVPYYNFNIFNAPLLLALRASTFVMGRAVLATNPNVSVFNINFQNNDGAEGRRTARVFAIEGPVMYGVSENRSSRQLPYMNLLPRLTNSYVASLAATTNIEPQEDRIFAAQTAKYHKYEVNTLNTKMNKFRLTNITDAGQYL